MSFRKFLDEKALVKGAFHRWLGKSLDEPITAADIAKGKAAGGHPEKMAVQAQNFREGVESPVTGTRIVSKHGVGSKHHAEVRYHKDYQEYSVHHYTDGKHRGEGPVSYHGNDKKDATDTAEHEVKRQNVSEEVIVEGIKNHQRFAIKPEYRHLYSQTHHSNLKAHSQPYKKPGDAHSSVEVGPGNDIGGHIEVASHHLQHFKEEVMVNEKVANNKEALEKAIAAAERKAAKSASKKESSYLEMLKKAYRRIKGRTNVRNDEVGIKEEVSAAPKFVYVTELSKSTLGSYRKKAIGQLKSKTGPLGKKEEKRFNGVSKSVKEEVVTEGKKLNRHDARKVFDKVYARHQSDQEAHAATPAGRAERDARNKAMLAKMHAKEEVSDAELDLIYEVDQAFHDQHAFTTHATKNGHHVSTVLRGTNAHLHAKNLATGKTHGLFDVKKNFGAYSHSPLHVGEAFEGDYLIGSDPINEEMSAEAHELVLHADNDRHLHHSSHQPIIKNLKKKAKAGKYDSEKAKKLWGYHADRAAQSYHKQHGSGGKWHHMFSTEHRRQAAAHFEAHHRAEVHE